MFSKISALTGLPVHTTRFAFGKIFSWSGKPVMTRAAPLDSCLFALPGKAFASCMMTGTLRLLAAYSSGALTKPPVLITASGLNSLMSFLHSDIPFRSAVTAGKILSEGLVGIALA